MKKKLSWYVTIDTPDKLDEIDCYNNEHEFKNTCCEVCQLQTLCSSKYIYESDNTKD